MCGILDAFVYIRLGNVKHPCLPKEFVFVVLCLGHSVGIEEDGGVVRDSYFIGFKVIALLNADWNVRCDIHPGDVLP